MYNVGITATETTMNDTTTAETARTTTTVLANLHNGSRLPLPGDDWQAIFSFPSAADRDEFQAELTDLCRLGSRSRIVGKRSEGRGSLRGLFYLTTSCKIANRAVRLPTGA